MYEMFKSLHPEMSALSDTGRYIHRSVRFGSDFLIFIRKIEKITQKASKDTEWSMSLLGENAHITHPRKSFP